MTTTVQGVRRSGRIAKKIPIILEGTDTAGRYFREETHTVVLSRHGAGVISSNKPGPDEPLTICISETQKKTQVRLVGRMGGDASLFIYGVAFVDPAINFWETDFPPGERYTVEPEKVGVPILLECCLCQSRQEMSDSEIDADVYAINQNILMFCYACGITSIWKLAKTGASRSRQTPFGERASAPDVSTASRADMPAFASRLSTAPVAGSFARRPHIPVDQVSAHSTTLLLTTAETLDSAPALQEDAGVAVTPVLHCDSIVLAMPPAAPLPSTAPPLRPKNRRRDVRAGVTFTACIRHSSGGEELVECDNISRGGFSFRSRNTYLQGSRIEAAVPYSPGGHAIFVNAHIQRVEELPGGNYYRHGVSYDTSSPTS